MITLVLFIILGWYGISEMGVVGEVAWTWMGGTPNGNLAEALPLHKMGPLTAASTRPMESLQLGELSLPLVVNLYTGGIADWPARLLSPLGLQATMSFHLLAGALLIGLVHRFVRLHGSSIAANAAALLLATDWIFIFFRRALGGTELLLQAASLLCLWALWSRRWGGGRHGLVALAVGIGLGLAAKLTFILTLLPMGLAALLTRWDKPRLGPPLPDRWGAVALGLVVPLIPMLVAWSHHLIADLQPIASHDHLSTQFERLHAAFNSGPRPPRESLAALTSWIGQPTSFLSAAWGAEAPGWFSPLRFLGWILIGLGTATAWWNRHETPRLALTRFCSVFLVLQVAATWGIARDLHHLAVATPTLMILAGLSLDILAGHWTPPRSPRRGALVLAGCLPWAWVGTTSVMDTDAALLSIDRPTISANGQAAVVEMLRRQDVRRVITLDYESAGAFDLLAPEIQFQHGWTRILDNRPDALSSLLESAAGAHLLVIRESPAWTYNLRPRALDLARAGAQVGVETAVVDRLPDDAAVLYAVGSQTGLP